MRRALIVCHSNSCRSQMAEGLINAFVTGWIADSAGIEPAEAPNPLALQVLVEIGVPTEGLAAKSLDDMRLDDYDRIIVVCDKDSCLPLYLGDVTRKPFTDPSGGDIDRFRECRDEILQWFQGSLEQE